MTLQIDVAPTFAIVFAISTLVSSAAIYLAFVAGIEIPIRAA
jgi:hypothetical protein